MGFGLALIDDDDLWRTHTSVQSEDQEWILFIVPLSIKISIWTAVE